MWLVAQLATPLVTDGGLKPPWNQPQVMFLLAQQGPDIAAFGAEVIVQSSWAATGRGSPMIVPLSTVLAMSGVVAPWVWPLIRLSAPTVDGPKVELNELSLMEKCWV
jgi:hypothetical protein